MPLIPIDASKTPPVAGSAIALPGVPNSIVFDRAAHTAYIGTNVGLVVLDTTSNVASLVTPVADRQSAGGFGGRKPGHCFQLRQ